MKRIKPNETVSPQLLFYTHLPQKSINHLDFQSHIKNRLKIHRTFESKHDLTYHPFYASTPEGTNEDIISHFCTRLVCGVTLWSCKWFVKAESLYFKKKLDSMDEKDVYKYFYEHVVRNVSHLGREDDYFVFGYDSFYLDGSESLEDTLVVDSSFYKNLSDSGVGRGQFKRGKEVNTSSADLRDCISTSFYSGGNFTSDVINTNSPIKNIKDNIDYIKDTNFINDNNFYDSVSRTANTQNEKENNLQNNAKKDYLSEENNLLINTGNLQNNAKKESLIKNNNSIINIVKSKTSKNEEDSISFTNESNFSDKSQLGKDKTFTNKKQTIFEQLLRKNTNKEKGVNMKTQKYKIYFTKAIDALPEITPNKGYFDLNITTLKSLLINLFRKYLEKKILSLNRILKDENDERLQKLHSDLFSTNTEPCSTNSLSNIEEYFPPCISGLIKQLKTEKHIKYKDRLTLARFFKDSGLSVEETVQFFKNNFNMTEAVFAKEYLYSIRHTYGLEGKRAVYQSYSCKQVLENGKDRSVYGCPFVSNKTYVKEYAGCKGIKEVDIEDLWIDKNPQKRCGCLLAKIVDDKETGVVVNTPIGFYKEYKEKKENKDNK